ncbi:MAG: prolipoprotein diacylglyceryl transferase [Flavisolibacter sp.]
MYPNLYYFFRDCFGLNLVFLRFINSFGFFVAISFLVAAALLAKELGRKSKQGLLHPTEIKHKVGEPVTVTELIMNFILGFILGYKIIALFFLSSEATQDPQAYIFSGMGNLPAGILTGLFFAGLKWWEKRRHQLDKPEERMVRIWPQDRVGELTIIALVVGLAGAKLFDIFENWNDFLKNPSAYIFSGGGLTFYGGLICATIAIIFYARKHKIGIRYLADAIAPSLMIAYAVGRIGCQVAGDGDWGIYNTAFKVDSTSKIVPAAPQDFGNAFQAFPGYAQENPEPHHADFPKPGALSFLPNWFFAYNYPHNVNEVGVPIPGCNEKYCRQLPAPVFPTPMYETIMCTLLFLVLWFLRDRLRPAGALFCLYLILNGVERFFIEKIRVNNRMNFFGFHPTQAEVISAGLVLVGAGLWIFLRQKYRTIATEV